MQTHDGATGRQVRAGDCLRTLLDKAGLSQRQVARHLKVTDPAVSSWVHGTHAPRDCEGLEGLLKSRGIDIPTWSLKTLWEPDGVSPELADALDELGIPAADDLRHPGPEPEGDPAASAAQATPDPDEGETRTRSDGSTSPEEPGRFAAHRTVAGSWRPRSIQRRHLVVAIGIVCLLVLVGFLSTRGSSESGTKSAPAEHSSTATPGAPTAESVPQPVEAVAGGLWSQCKADDVLIRSAPGAVVDASTRQINRGEVFVAETVVSTEKGQWLRGQVRNDPSRHGYVPTNFFCKL